MTIEQRYQRVRMCVFRPEYLVVHTKPDDADFTALIDAIVELQEIVEKRSTRKLHCGVCAQLIGTIGLTVRPFVGYCAPCSERMVKRLAEEEDKQDIAIPMGDPNATR